MTPIGKIFLKLIEPVFRKKKRREEDFYYTGDPEDYARLVFRRYGSDGKSPAKRGHLILLIVFILAFLASI